MYIFLGIAMFVFIATSAASELYPLRTNTVPDTKAIVVDRITPPGRPNQHGITCLIVLHINDALYEEALKSGARAYMYLPGLPDAYTSQEIRSMIDIERCRWKTPR